MRQRVSKVLANTIQSNTAAAEDSSPTKSTGTLAARAGFQLLPATGSGCHTTHNTQHNTFDTRAGGTRQQLKRMAWRWLRTVRPRLDQYSWLSTPPSPSSTAPKDEGVSGAAHGNHFRTHTTRDTEHQKSMWLLVTSSSTSEQHAVQTPARTPNMLAEEPKTVGTTDLASKRAVEVDGSGVMIRYQLVAAATAACSHKSVSSTHEHPSTCSPTRVARAEHA
jgi:hypothetical protein